MTHDLKVFRQYSLTPMIVSYVLDPLGAALLTGEQAWNLPIDYVASGYHPDNNHYHWKKPDIAVVDARRAPGHPERWLELFDRTATPASPGDLGGR